jgi:hypothetical protein
MFLMALLSVMVEYMPEKTASRLTAFPARMLFHSESGNLGTRFEPRTIRLVALRSSTWFCISLQVRSWLAVRAELSLSSSASQAKSDSSREHFSDEVRPSGELEQGLLDTGVCPRSPVSESSWSSNLSPHTAAIFCASSCWSSIEKYIPMAASTWSD